MAALSISVAAFSGFSVVKHRPWLVLVWAATWFGSMILIGIVFAIIFVASGAGALMSAGNNLASNPSALAPFIGGLLAGYLFALIFLLLVKAVMVNAVYRSVLRPDDVGFAYIKLGAAEFRQLAVSLVIGLVIGL